MVNDLNLNLNWKQKKELSLPVGNWKGLYAGLPHSYLPLKWQVDKNRLGLDSMGTSAVGYVLIDFVSFTCTQVIQQNG